MMTPKQVGKQESFPNQVLSGAPIVLSSKTENYRALMFNQTTAAINVLLPNPDDTSIAFAIDVFNSGTADLSVNGLSVPASGANRIGWNPATSAFESVAGASSGASNIQNGAYAGIAPAVDTLYVNPALGPFDFQNNNLTTAFDTATATHFDKLLVERATKNVGSATYITAAGNFQWEWNATGYVFINSGIIKFFDGFYEGQTVELIRGADWSVTQPTFTSFAGTNFVTNANAPTGNSISSIKFVWRDALNVWEATYVAASAGTASLTVASVAPATATAKAGDLWWDDTNLEFYVLHDDGVTKAWVSTSGTTLNGDVVGPASATDNAIARYDTATGKLIQNSLVLIDDAGSITGVKDFDMTGRGLSGIDTIVGGIIDLATGNTFTATINAATTFAFSNLPPNTRTQTITILVNLVAGSIGFGAAVRWPANTTPTFATGKKHLITMITYDGGGTWYATASLDYI